MATSPARNFCAGLSFWGASGGWGKGKKETLWKGLSLFPFPQTPIPISLPKLFVCASRKGGEKIYWFWRASPKAR
ncbi:hypothetical protein SYK_16750 [Pseudodesulfovibrio nedwellii]|uniref:Uncharacterized protein n=1 Tax=Pseudodesulfovibrio nedwellii TaxID=2973072 RepID=A0ABM8B163_9BACT|nr:hypothetical protein SYK_16750 [Pseudodesulfovibrio nedwellii]